MSGLGGPGARTQGPRESPPGGPGVDQTVTGSARHENEQVIDPLGVLIPEDELAVKPNVVLPSAAIVPL